MNESNRIEFIQRRLDLWNKLKAVHDEQLQSKASESIKVKLPYGRVYDGVSWQSTPNKIFEEIYKKSAIQPIVAKVDNQLWDLSRPLETNCQLELVTFEDPLGKQVLWHSAAHVLGAALESIYGCLLNTGPATENGFFYDIHNHGKNVSIPHLECKS